MDTPVFELVAQSPDLHAQYETILACGLAAAGQYDTAHAHRLRAERLYSSLHHAPGLLELSRCWEAALEDAPAAERRRSNATSQTAAAPGTVLQAVAALMVQASRPEFLSHELVNLLGQTGCVRRAAALLVDRTREPEVLAATDAAGIAPYVADAWPRRLVVGRSATGRRNCGLSRLVISSRLRLLTPSRSSSRPSTRSNAAVPNASSG